MKSRRFNHRTLGIGATRPTAGALARTDAMLNDIGSRVAVDLTAEVALDSVGVALLTFVAEVDDLVVEVDPAGYRAQLPLSVHARSARPRRLMVLAPMASAAAAVVLIAVVAIAHRTGSATPVATPRLVATDESQKLIHHASSLLSSASRASSGDRQSFVHEARADLHHAASLVPLVAPSSRPMLQSQIHQLRIECRTQHANHGPASTSAPQRTPSPPTPTAGTGAGTTQRQPPSQPSSRPTHAPATQPTQRPTTPPSSRANPRPSNHPQAQPAGQEQGPSRGTAPVGGGQGGGQGNGEHGSGAGLGGTTGLGGTAGLGGGRSGGQR